MSKIKDFPVSSALEEFLTQRKNFFDLADFDLKLRGLIGGKFFQTSLVLIGRTPQRKRLEIIPEYER